MRPTYLFGFQENTIAEIKAKINSKSKLLLLCDYDGTLTPIRDCPSMAVLSMEMQNLIAKLNGKTNLVFGLVTGREYEDISSLIDEKNILTISNHGFQILKREKKWIHPKAKKKIPLMNEIFHLLTNTISPTLIENKILTITIHYRNLESNLITELKKNFFDVTNQFEGKVRITKGRKILEIRPDVNWNKGMAVLKIIKSLNLSEDDLLIIYLGDDITDEDVFLKLPTNALTVLVGRKQRTAARYFLKNTGEVQKFLEWIDSEIN